MRIGIITFVKCDNYGAELQAYALQKKLNLLGYDAEVINLEKRKELLKVRSVHTKMLYLTDISNMA